ncbi:MAG: PAS domain S-box protein [Bacteroidota bacterium]
MNQTLYNSENEFDQHLLTKLFPLAISMLVVYVPYSFFVSNEYLAGILQFFSLVALIYFKVRFRQLKDLNILKDLLIFLGFPVLLPWLLTGGPADNGLWWSPTYVLWVSFFAKGTRYFLWLLAFVGVSFVCVVLSRFGLFSIAYDIQELLHLLFAFSISTMLIYYYETWRAHYKTRLEEELQKRIQTQEKYGELLATAPDAIIVSSQRGEIVMVNLQTEKMFGYQHDELIGSKIEKLLPEHMASKHMEHVHQYFLNPGIIQNVSGDRFFARHKSGKEFPIELSLSLNKSEHLVTAVIRDVTERHLMTRQLMKQNVQLNDFAYMASHDIRGPVFNLKSVLGFLREEQDVDKQKYLLQTSVEIVDNLNETLNNLLEIVSAHNQTVKLGEVSFDEVMQKILHSYAPEIKATQASVSYDFSKVNRLIYSQAYLESIMQNLLSNALKYKSPDRTPVINFETHSQNGQALLKVSDNGLGIDMEKFGSKVFGLKKTFHKHPAAKGIGLYMIKSHIESLGGEINIHSQVNVGTTFTVLFNKKVS